MQPEIIKTRPDAPEAARLIEELETHLATRYPVESRHGYSVGKLLEAGVDFFLVWVDGSPAGCGGVKPIGKAYAELKRMYIRPVYRRRGLGRQLLAHLQRVARQFGVPLLRLETGRYQTGAIRLYESWGFRQVPPFGDYREDPLSLCYEMPLD